jgi:hypothetical protein
VVSLVALFLKGIAKKRSISMTSTKINMRTLRSGCSHRTTAVLGPEVPRPGRGFGFILRLPHQPNRLKEPREGVAVPRAGKVLGCGTADVCWPLRGSNDSAAVSMLCNLTHKHSHRQRRTKDCAVLLWLPAEVNFVSVGANSGAGHCERALG